MASFFKKRFTKIRGNSADKLYECNRGDYDDTYRIAKRVMGLVTIRLTRKMSPFASKCWDWFYWFEFSNVSIALTLEFISMVQTARGGAFEDAVKIFRMMPCCGMVVLGIAKSFMMVYHHSVFENLVRELGDMWPTGRVTEAEGRIIHTARKELIFVVKGYYWCNHALLVSFLLPPIIESIKRDLGYESEMLLPFFYWLPFDPFQPVIIEILLAIQTWQALVVIWCNLAGDLLFCSFLSHLTTQFDLLSLRIQGLIYVPIDKQLMASYPLSNFNKQHGRDGAKSLDLNDIEMERKHEKDLTEIILKHKTLIRLCGDVERMFTFALLLNFINSSIIICFCGFCCVLVEKWNEIAYKSFLVTALSQTYLICWYGQKLLDSSTGFSSALYNSGWYNASKKTKSSIIIMIHRAQKAVRITTYGFSVVSLESYTKIIKTAWSYFTLLLNIYKQ